MSTNWFEPLLLLGKTLKRGCMNVCEWMNVICTVKCFVPRQMFKVDLWQEQKLPLQYFSESFNDVE